ncbi:MAG: GNAT family N-acetyltransferase [Lachnospiraceae bacterium]|nr:GNAT family N-acetyltransferase [Lachnospiraceae bacterium]
MVIYQIVGTPEGEEVLATENGTRLGRLSYEIDGAICNITYLYVEPGERRTGIATMLMLTLWDRVFETSEVNRIDVLLPREMDDVESFLEKMEFSRDDSLGYFVSFRLGDVFESRLMREAHFPTEEEVMLLCDVRSPGLVSSLQRSLEDSGFNCDVKKLFRICDPKSSMVLVRDGEIRGFTAVTKNSDSRVTLYFLYVDPEWSVWLASLLRATAEKTREVYGEDCEVSAFENAEAGMNVVKKLVPEGKYSMKPLIAYTLAVYDKDGE